MSTTATTTAPIARSTNMSPEEQERLWWLGNAVDKLLTHGGKGMPTGVSYEPMYRLVNRFCFYVEIRSCM